jgi:hypothetical protein
MNSSVWAVWAAWVSKKKNPFEYLLATFQHVFFTNFHGEKCLRMGTLKIGYPLRIKIVSVKERVALLG